VAVAVDVAVVLPDESIDGGQAQPRRAAGLLGREERLEDVGAHLGSHAAAGMGRLAALPYQPVGLPRFSRMNCFYLVFQFQLLFQFLHSVGNMLSIREHSGYNRVRYFFLGTWTAI